RARERDRVPPERQRRRVDLAHGEIAEQEVAGADEHGGEERRIGPERAARPARDGRPQRAGGYLGACVSHPARTAVATQARGERRFARGADGRWDHSVTDIPPSTVRTCPLT